MTQLRPARFAAACLGTAALLLAGCAARYQPIGPGGGGGYADRQIAPGRHAVEYYGSGNTPGDTVANMYLYRCAELTAQNQFDVFRSLSPEAAARAGWALAPAAPAGMVAMADTAIGTAEPTEFKSGGTTRYVPVYTPGGTVTVHTVKGVVQMGRYADVPSNVRVWDARIVMKTLEPLIKGQQGAKAMKAEDLVKVAMVPGRGRASSSASGTSLDDLQHLLQQSEGKP